MEVEVNKIVNLEQKKAVDALKTYLDSVDNQQLLDYVCLHAKNASFSTFWGILLQTFEESQEDHEKRLQVSIELLNSLENNTTSTMHCYNLATRLCVELPKFKTKDLQNLCNICLDYIQKGSSQQMAWKDIFPEVLSIMSDRSIVEYDGVDITGTEYRQKTIEALCSMQWDPNILTPLVTMFIDMQLSKDEHIRIVNKLCQNINSLTCTELPALVYQMLRLCRSLNGRNIFMQLQNYFNIRIYSKPFNEGSTDLNFIDDAVNEEYIQAESTILYHIHQAASLGYETIKDYLNSLKHLTKAPEHILKPFQLTVLLSIGSICFYEETVFDLIRSAISRCLNEETRKGNSYWLTETLKKPVDIEEVFSKIISLCGENRDFVLQGLVGIAFNLLGVGAALGRDDIAEKQWFLGKKILLKLIKMKRHTANSIVQMLCNKVMIGQNASAHIDCLHLLIKSVPLVMLENQTHILDMINTLVQVPYSTAINILDTVIPLVKISPTIRDHLILLLRKALYSRSTNTRQAAVTGFLKLLKKLKISNLTALSQNSSSSSGHSVLTQISLSHIGRAKTLFSNEALCLEVLGILKKCFTQQAEVRLQLYEGLYEATCKNPELTETVFEVLWNHFLNFKVLEDDAVPPLQFEKVTITKDTKVTIIEPLGKLVFVIGLMLVNIKKEELGDPDKYDTFFKIINTLCEQMAKCELEDFELNETIDFTNDSAEANQKIIILQEVLHVFDALMGYQIYNWDRQKSGEMFSNLFQAYSRFIEFQKNLLKPKKADKRKKKDADNTTQNVTVSKNTSSSKSIKANKQMDTVLTFKVLEKALELLYTDINWSTATQTNLLKTKPEIHQYVLQSTLALANLVKSNKSVDQEHIQSYYHLCGEIGLILYSKIISKLEELINFDIHSANLGIECLHSILLFVLSHCKADFGKFLSKISENDSEDLVNVLSMVLETYQKNLKIDIDNAEFKTLKQNLVNSYVLLCGQIPQKSHVSLKTVDWLKTYLSETAEKDKNIAVNFVTLTFNLNRKYRDSTAIVENVLLKVSELSGTLDDTVPNFEDLSIVDDASCNGALQASITILKTMLDDIDWVILRLKSEFAYIQYPGCENYDNRREEISEKEKNICVQICLIAMQIALISNISVRTGPVLEGILKLLTHFYNTLNVLTKYFMSRSTKVNVVFQKARFEHVVKMAGKTLSPIVYKLILFIDEYQKQETNAQNQKKDPSTLKNKVLKETKLIPKVVYEIEQCSRSIIQISNKTKVDLTKYIGQGTTRDFRLLQLKEVVEKTRLNSENEDDTTTDSTHQTEEENEASDETCVSDNEENSQPPKKKNKV